MANHHQTTNFVENMYNMPDKLFINRAISRFALSQKNHDKWFLKLWVVKAGCRHTGLMDLSKAFEIYLVFLVGF